MYWKKLFTIARWLGDTAASSANLQLISRHTTPLAWHFGDEGGIVDLLHTPDNNVQIVFTDAPLLRQKETQKKVTLVKYQQLLDTTDLAVRTVNVRRTNKLATDYSLFAGDQTFKGKIPHTGDTESLDRCGS